MANLPYAKEWLTFSQKNLDTAILLFNANHHTDIIGIELQQTLEKLLKSIMANQNIRIPKEHDLVKLYFIVEKYIEINEDEIILLKIATNYYKEDRYPNPNYSLPPKKEIKQVLDFSVELFDKVCTTLSINMDKN
ncbi:MAG: HEPN domain-containing protein [Helicobacteraceae bacterium]|nr:HEPN domain-containing protein [Helicobacteraceae bacterium]